jgi:hypothetical protein
MRGKMEDINKNFVQGHVLIKDLVTGEVLVDKKNAINYENFSISLARTIADRPDSWIQDMVFGNGAATVSGTGTITYLPPNVVGLSAQLYNETYSKCVNDMSPLNLDPIANFITTAHTSGTTYTDVIVTCNLGVGEPAGQDAFDTATTLTGPYVFNELGLKAFDSNGPAEGRLLTHVVFSPVQKSLNRQLSIVYTIRIQTV